MAGRNRNSFAKPKPCNRGQNVRAEFELPDIFLPFRGEHRIMEQVQSL